MNLAKTVEKLWPLTLPLLMPLAMVLIARTVFWASGAGWTDEFAGVSASLALICGFPMGGAFAYIMLDARK